LMISSPSRKRPSLQLRHEGVKWRHAYAICAPYLCSRNG
jgi:hypothetical protein